MEKKRKSIMEYVWLVVAIISLGFGVHATIHKGIGESYVFGIMFIFTVLIYFWRRNLRRKEEEALK